MLNLKNILFKLIPSDYFSKKYPISVKGIVIVNGKIVLLKNNRNEWELPGGKIEVNEAPDYCVIREIKEELNLDVTLNTIIDTWMYSIQGKVNVFIVTYLCNPLEIDESTIIISHEHKEMGMFGFDEIESLNMPQGYKNSIKISEKFL